MPTTKIRNAHSAATVLASIPGEPRDRLSPSSLSGCGYERAVLLPLISFALNGCAQRGAPSFALFGAYFPAWMLCALLGIFASIGARAVFVATGLSNTLPFQLFVCMAIGTCFALLAWFFWFA